jgi:hypothetical protein
MNTLEIAISIFNVLASVAGVALIVFVIAGTIAGLVMLKDYCIERRRNH